MAFRTSTTSIGGGGGGGGGVGSVTAADGTIVVAGTAAAPTLRANVGTGVGTVAAGDDSRFTRDINQLTGDVTAGPASGSTAATLATVNSNVGSFTKATITVNGKGLVTAASAGTPDYTDENAQDAVGVILTSTPTVSLVYDDPTPTITANVIFAGLSNQQRTTGFVYTDFLGNGGTANGEAVVPFDGTALSGGTQNKIDSEPDHPGILSVTSSSSNNSGIVYGTSVTAFLIGGGETGEIIFQPKIVANVGTTVRLGYGDAVGVTAPTDGCYFELAPGSLDLTGNTASNGTRSTTGTLATLVVNTWYRAKVSVNSTATSVLFEVFDSAGTLLGSASLTSNIPTGAGRQCGFEYVATQIPGLTADLIWVDYMAAWNTRALVR